MSSSFIEIVRHPYEEPYHLNLVVVASNGTQRGELEIYSNASDLGVFAQAIRKLPAQASDATWELGSELPDARFGFHFRLRAYRLSLTGHCAIEVRFNNN